LPPIVDAGNAASSAAASLRTPLLYDILAPASNVLDTLTLLTPAQYWGTFALGALIFFSPGLVRDFRRPRGFRAAGMIATCLRFIGGMVAIIGIMLIATRPMASLSLQDPDLVAVDFHSHTSASHDGRADFDAERNREWHQSSGFNVAYVTDHRTLAGAISAAERNPTLAGEGTTLLPGVELRDGDEHPLLLGVDPKRMKITSPDWRGAAVAPDGGPAPPILILTLPGNTSRVPQDENSGPIRLAAIEGSDGSPRGMAQAGRDRRVIFALADSLHLAIVSGSDNHGWGRAAPAWSVLRIPGWRALTPAALDIAIRQTLLSRAPGTTEIILRRSAAPPPSGKVESALSGPAVALSMLRTLNPRERVSWILWSWAAAFLSLIRARRNRRQLRTRIRERMRRTARRPLIDAAAAMGAAS